MNVVPSNPVLPSAVGLKRRALRHVASVVLLALSMFGVTGIVLAPGSATAGPALIAQPGDEIGTNVTNNSGKIRVCTIGFLTMTSDPTPAFLTAGHCAPKAGMPVFGNPDGIGARRIIGYSRVVEFAGTAVRSTDIALVDVSAGENFARLSALPNGVAVSGVSNAVDLERYNPVLCKQGYVTGQTCGRIVKFVGSDKLTFEAGSAHGDSGAPVYAVWPDGTYTAVGLLNGSPVSDEGVAVVQLIAPWMSSWALRLAR
jgi:hypothetical protein